MMASSELAKPAVLVAPLDWGLGHATRCVPIVDALLRKGCRVLVAGEGKVRDLFDSEFPSVDFLELKGYRIRYARSAWGTTAQIVAQIPKMMSAVAFEQRWLQKQVAEHRINAIISDNRYGLFHSQIPSVFMTHQLRIRSGFGAVADRMLQRLNYRYLNRFSRIWVPDYEKMPGLAGALSHPMQLPKVPVRYIGPLSRFERMETESAEDGSLVILLSGPEPQRTLFEQQCLKGLRGYQGKAFLVRGLPGRSDMLDAGPHVQVFNHLPKKDLTRVLTAASFVVARSGYSTIMDLARLQKKATLVPTPGQAEQIYLANHLEAQGWAFVCRQPAFQLLTAVEAARNFAYKNYPSDNDDAMSAEIDDLVKMIRKA